MMVKGNWNEMIHLISEEHIQDVIGNYRETQSKIAVYANKRPVSRSEFYFAGQSGTLPDLIFIIHPYEYNNQQLVEYNGSIYSVIRTYFINDEELELICRKKVRNYESQ